MLTNYFVTIAISTVLGALSSLGVGGGSLLILWLTLVLQLPYPSARILNLLFFIPGAIVSSFYRLKGGSLPIRKAIRPILSGCIGAAIFSILGKQIDPTILRKLFGGLLLLIGLRELFYRPRKPK